MLVINKIILSIKATIDREKSDVNIKKVFVLQ